MRVALVARGPEVRHLRLVELIVMDARLYGASRAGATRARRAKVPEEE